MQNRYVLSILVQNHYGVLRRISSLFSRRGYSIESLSSGDAEKPELSRVTVVARGDEDIIDQIKKQVSKLVEVVGVTIFEDDKAVYRELMLIKVKTTRSTRAEIMEITDIFRAHIVDVAPSSLVLEVTGDSKNCLRSSACSSRSALWKSCGRGLPASSAATRASLPNRTSRPGERQAIGLIYK